MAAILVIFTVGVWLGIRSILTTLHDLSTAGDHDLVRIAELHFTFAGLARAEGHNLVAHGVRYLALWFPFVALFVSSTLDYLPVFAKMFGSEKFYVGGPGSLMARGLFLLLTLFVIAASCQASTNMARAIDRLVRQR